MSSIDRLAGRIADNQIILAIRKGLIYMMPLVLIGSVVLTLLNLPIQVYQDFLIFLFRDHWRTVLLYVHSATFRIMAFSALITISYAFGSEMQEVKSGEINPVSIVIVSFSSYFAFMTLNDESTFDLSDAGSTGLFGAIAVAVIATYVYVLIYRYRPRTTSVFAYDADTILLSSLRSTLPAFLTILLFALARLVVDLSGLRNLVNGIYQDFCDTLISRGGSLPTAILFSLCIHILWIFGLHGTNILDRVAADLFVTASDANIALAAAGEAPVHILTKEFFDAFVYIGGSGCTLGLLIALLISGRTSNVNKLAHFSILPGIFNINEMMVYGLPIVFNPYYLIPFLFTPALLCITTYIAFSAGLVPLTFARVQWTTPIVISGYASTGSVAGVILQLFNLALAVVVYIPFIRLYERDLAQNNIGVLERLKNDVIYIEQEQRHTTLRRSDEVGILARALATELREAMEQKTGALHLNYQPKVNKDGKVIGAEALLRYKHDIYGMIPPPVVVALCEEAGINTMLGRYVYDTVLEGIQTVHSLGYRNLRISVNFSPQQIKEDAELVNHILHGLRNKKLRTDAVEVELVESAAIDQSDATRSKLRLLKEHGVSIAIDDFAMGSSSLLYVRDFYANVIKLDRSLVNVITTDVQSQGIVRSIVDLCVQLGLELVAEGVETREQAQKLWELGCGNFQGYYYAKPMQLKDYIAYLQKVGTSMATPPRTHMEQTGNA